MDTYSRYCCRLVYIEPLDSSAFGDSDLNVRQLQASA